MIIYPLSPLLMKILSTFPKKFNLAFADFYYYSKEEKTLYVFQISISILTHSNRDTQFIWSDEYQKLIHKPDIIRVQFVWLTDEIDINPELQKQFQKKLNQPNEMKKGKRPKDEESLIVMARRNREVWRFAD